MLSVKVKCPICGEEVDVNNKQIKRKEVYLCTKEGGSIFLTYYDCPACQQQVTLQVDDEESLSILDDLQMLFANNARLRLEGEEVPAEDLERFEKARKDLKNLRTLLSDKLAGSLIYDTDEHKFSVIRFGFF